VVALDQSWKISIGYFLINGLTGKELANLVTEAVTMLVEVGITVVSLTLDGPANHLAMLTELGVSLKPGDLRPFFTVNSGAKIYVLLDPCHMLKLMRNRLATDKVIIDNEGRKVEWRYIKMLHELQEGKGLHLANKLRKKHIEWKSMKMTVDVAAQTLSCSVAKAIDFCRKELMMEEFRGSEATTNFVFKIDHLFDILNSRNPTARGFKAPLKESNHVVWRPFMTEMYSYLEGLLSAKGRPLVETNGKTPVLGLLVCILSATALFL